MRRSFVGVPVDEPSSTGRIEPHDAETAVQQPWKKKHKPHRKPPPGESTGNLSEESKLTTPRGASLHVRERVLAETRSTRQSEPSAATMPRQMQFIFSPKASRSNNIVPGTVGIHIGTAMQDLPRPMQQNESSDLTSQPTIASLPSMGSSLLDYATMSARRQQAALSSHQVFPPPQPSSHPSLLTSHLAGRFHAPPQHSSVPNSSGYQATLMAWRAPQTMPVSHPLSTYGIGHSTQVGLAVYPRSSQIPTGTLTVPHDPQPQNVLFDSLFALGSDGRAPVAEQRATLSLPQSEASPFRLPATLSQDTDILHLNAHQVYLRTQIEVFEATEDDLSCKTRGRNKGIHVGQVGIRCRHCAHITARHRQTATMYFLATLGGLYQAAQNMSTNHIQCGLCNEMPDSVKIKFVELLPTKNTISRAGRRYWEETAGLLGLIDTENGIAFQRHSR